MNPEHIIRQLVTALEGSGTRLRSDQWYVEIEAVAAGKRYLAEQPAEEPAHMWQPIETAPKNGQMILVCLPRLMNLVVRAWYRDYKGFWLTDQETDGGISRPAFFHEGDLWHPVPSLPQAQPEENLYDLAVRADNWGQP